MVRRKRVNRVGRLGPRYGKRVRNRVSEAEADLRRKHYCPSCEFRAVKRVSVGVWKCRKCSYTFAGAAYSPTSEVGKIVTRNVSRGT